MDANKRRAMLDKIKPLEEGEDVSNMIYVCMRVEDLPTPPVESRQTKCVECKKAVWFDKRHGKHAFNCAKILCMHCTVEHAKNES